MDISQYILPRYSFAEINEYQKKLSLDDKEAIAIAIINKAMEMCSQKAAVAFSGGKDSEVVCDLIERHCPEHFVNIHCIFGNTGIEFPESLKFARKYGKEHFGERFHETELEKLEEDELRYDFAQELVQRLEDENALEEILKPDGKLKGQKALIDAALRRGYVLDRSNCFFKGHKKTFMYCVEQYGAPLLGKASSKLDAHRINIECFLKYSKTSTDDEKLKEYYEILRNCKFSQHCCKLLKKDPSERLQAELGVDVIFKGLMASESHNRMTSFATRGHIFESHRPHLNTPFYHVNPLGLWTDDDVWGYIHKYNLEYSPLYDISFVDDSGKKQYIKRNGCVWCGTDIQFANNHLATLRQTHPKLYEACMDKMGYREQLYRLFKIKKNVNILSSFTDDGTKARLIERFGNDLKKLAEIKPCVYDDFGNLVEITGTGFDTEYDAEVFETPDGQIQFF